MSDTIIHLLVREGENFARWACLCVISLIRNGMVPPEKIYVTLNDNLSDTVAAQILHKLGVNVKLVDENIIAPAKVVHVNLLFDNYPEVKKIIHLDVDMVLRENVDFIKTISEMSEECDMAAFFRGIRPGKFLEIFTKRKPMMGFRYDVLNERERLRGILRGIYGFELDDFIKWLMTNDGWIWGGLIIFNRSVTSKQKIWNAIQTFSWISFSDETGVGLAIFASVLNPNEGIHVKHLDSEKFQVVVSPREFNIENGHGMIHFAGDNYRLRTKHRVIWGEAFEKLMMEVGI